jgi:WD40 repeat protein
VWDLKDHQCELILKGHNGDVNCLELQGNTLASGSGDSTVKIWNMSSGKCVSTLRGDSTKF